MSYTDPEAPRSEHRTTIIRKQIGMTPISPSRPVYGTVFRCSCGERQQINNAPSKGGQKMAKIAEKRHLDALPNQN